MLSSSFAGTSAASLAGARASPLMLASVGTGAASSVGASVSSTVGVSVLTSVMVVPFFETRVPPEGLFALLLIEWAFYQAFLCKHGMQHRNV